MPITMIATSTLAFSGASTLSGANTPPNMNGNYTISTGVGTFSTAHHDYEGGVESFTLYSPPIASRVLDGVLDDAGGRAAARRHRRAI